MTSSSDSPAKGRGNGSPKRPPFNSETGKAASLKGTWVRQKMAEWRKANPDAPESYSERRRQLREIMRDGTPEAVQAIREMIIDPKHKDRLAAAKTWVEQDLGRAMQAVELTGEDGSAVKIIFTTDDTGVL